MTAITALTYIGTDKITDNVRGRIIQEVQSIFLETASTATGADYFTFDIATVGGTTLLGIDAVKHTTDNSVIVDDAPTVSVSATTLTVTLASGTTDKRVVRIYFI